MSMTQAIAPGYTIRPQRPDEASSAAEFIVRVDEQLSGYSDFSEEDLRELDRHPRFNLATDSWIVAEAGEIVGYARLWEEDANGVFESFGLVDPDHAGRGIGAELLARQEARVQESALDKGRAVALRSFVHADDRRGRALFSAAGYQMVRRLYTMTISLAARLPPADAPNGITIRTAPLDEAPLVHELLEDVFAQHWGHVPMSFDEWGEMVLKRADVDPTLWFIAEAGPDPVGILVADVEGSRGWVSDLGIRSEWRRQGIARFMLLHCFAELRRRGLAEAGLGVDAGNETGAVALYEAVGMSARKVYEAYEKSLEA
jgi:ribosomal protein S18 acetylase RimI-like enzyme